MLTRNLFTSDVKPIGSVPKYVLILLTILFCAQILWHILRPALRPEFKPLGHPPAVEILRLSSLDDPLVIAKMVMLWLQAYDNQPGISIPFNRLDYEKVILWLKTSLALDHRGQYPLLAASRLYTQVPDREKIVKMLDFVYQSFFQDPQNRWMWLAHCVYVAKYRLGDLDMALKYANALRLYGNFKEVPYWARHMEVFILEEMGEIEAAKILIGALLDGGRVSDAHEIRFLQSRLKELEELEAK